MYSIIYKEKRFDLLGEVTTEGSTEGMEYL